MMVETLTEQERGESNHLIEIVRILNESFKGVYKFSIDSKRDNKEIIYTIKQFNYVSDLDFYFIGYVKSDNYKGTLERIRDNVKRYKKALYTEIKNIKADG